MLSARLDLWDSNYKAALSSLEKISDSQAIQSPEYLMTRAFALFQKSEALKESQGYSEAVDLLGKALQKAPEIRFCCSTRPSPVKKSFLRMRRERLEPSPRS